MVQPKTPPLSIRPGEARLAKIDAYAEKRGLKRHAAVLELIDRGLAHDAMTLTRDDIDFAASYDFSPPTGASNSKGPLRKLKQGDPSVTVMRLPRALPGTRLKGAKK